jgi:hypothetical protein
MTDKLVVPPRNNFRKQPVFVKASIADVEGREAGFKYKWVEERDVNHPQHVSRFLKPQHVGDSSIGYAQADAWEVCSSKASEGKGRIRDDQGKPVDTAVRNGSLILVRTTEENHAVYDEYERLRELAHARRLRQGDSAALAGDNGGAATYKARFANDFAGSHRDLLNQPQGE